MECITNLLDCANRFVWGFPALLGILAVGLMYTVKTRFFQVRKLPLSIKEAAKSLKTPSSSGVSPFQAVCTALAATVGTGNIAGVAGAIAIGGPGAVFWMWMAAILGMILKYAEVVLAVRYQKTASDGTKLGGPMYFIRDGLPSGLRFLAPLYCVLGVVAAFGVGNCVQINTAVSAIEEALPYVGVVSGKYCALLLGLFMGILMALVVLGGAKRIGSVAELMIPLVCIGYIILSLGAIVSHRAALTGAIASIIQGAFHPKAMTGGAVGSAFLALRIGVSRGVFTNEAGMGTASIAHGGANTDNPVKQGLLGIFEVFVDTILICTLTALVILTAPIDIPYGTVAGGELTVAAFASVYGPWVKVFLAASMAILAFATVLGWGLYGTRCAQYLFGGKTGKLFPVFHAITTVLGAVISPAVVWSLSEMVNGLMAIPNLIALLLLSPEVIRLSKQYLPLHKKIQDSR